MRSSIEIQPVLLPPKPAYRQIHQTRAISHNKEFFPNNSRKQQPPNPFPLLTITFTHSDNLKGVASGNDPFGKTTPNPVHGKMLPQSLVGLSDPSAAFAKFPIQLMHTQSLAIIIYSRSHTYSRACLLLKSSISQGTN